MNFPHSPDQLAGWLEQHLVGLELAALVAELAARRESGPAPSLRALLGPYLPEVLGGGLGVLPAQLLRELCCHPRALLELQKLVLSEGGVYWGRVSATLQEEAPAPRAPWGWSSTDAMTGEASRAAYLHRLANGAQEWFDRRPAQAPQVGQRLGEFRQGCSRLIFATHDALPLREQEWLRARGRLWGQQVDQHLVALEKGLAPGRVCHEMDDTVRRIVEALRARAEGG